MRPRDHIILGSAASVSIFYLWDYGAVQNILYFWLASILIDIDHYLDYIYNNGFTDYSFKKMMKYHELLYSQRFEPGFLNLSIFHCVEVMAVLGIAGLYTGSLALLYIWWGFLFHIFFDTVKLIRDGKPSVRSNTAIGYFIKVRRFKDKGIDTKAFYTRAADEVRGNCAG